MHHLCMHTHMHISIYIITHAYQYIHAHRNHLYIHTHAYQYIHNNTCISMYISTYIIIIICISAHTSWSCAHTSAHMHHFHIHTHTCISIHTQSWFIIFTYIHIIAHTWKSYISRMYWHLFNVRSLHDTCTKEINHHAYVLIYCYACIWLLDSEFTVSEKRPWREILML